MRFLMENSYFTVGNVLLFRTVAVAMGSDPALFWVNIYLTTMNPSISQI